jgi:hypothetical protein
MPQLFGPQNLKLWIILAGLVVPFLIVGSKASIDRDLLKDDIEFKRPVIILETDPAPTTKFKNWDDAKEKIRTALKWDFVFLLIYPTAISLLCLIFARFLSEAQIIPFGFGLAVIGLQVVAAILDLVENVIVIRIIEGIATRPWLRIAYLCTLGKFAFIGVGMFYVVIGIGSWVYRSIAARY